MQRSAGDGTAGEGAARADRGTPPSRPHPSTHTTPHHERHPSPPVHSRIPTLPGPGPTQPSPVSLPGAAASLTHPAIIGDDLVRLHHSTRLASIDSAQLVLSGPPPCRLAGPGSLAAATSTSWQHYPGAQSDLGAVRSVGSKKADSCWLQYRRGMSEAYILPPGLFRLLGGYLSLSQSDLT